MALNKEPDKINSQNILNCLDASLVLIDDVAKIVYLNNKYLKYKDAKVHIEDRGLQFSDSVYEVVPFYNKKLIEFDFHIY